METGDAYEGKWGGSFGAGAPVLMGGKVYYCEYAAGDAYKNLVVWIYTQERDSLLELC